MGKIPKKSRFLFWVAFLTFHVLLIFPVKMQKIVDENDDCNLLVVDQDGGDADADDDDDDDDGCNLIILFPHNVSFIRCGQSAFIHKSCHDQSDDVQ